MQSIKGIAVMSKYKFTSVDFDNPSFLFVLEDKLKSLIGCLVYYNPYIKKMGLKGNENVLDFGCGGGTGSRCLVKALNSEGYLTCVDTSRYWIKRAAKRLSKYPNVDCQVGEIGELAIPDGCFDVITIMHVIHDIEPEKRQDTLKTLSQTLKNEGCLFIREPTRESHGISVIELRSLMKNARFWELEHEIKKSEYFGKYLKTTPPYDVIKNKTKYYYPLRY
jgi:ubiquinone/menaquinone biosynthesis C-methylase UbiE